MEVADPAGIELAGKLGGDGRRDQLPRRRQIVEALEQRIEPVGNVRSAGLGEAPGRGDVRHRQDSRHELDLHSGRRNFVLKAQEAFRGEEELRDRAVRAGIDLALEIIEIGFAVAGVRMDFRIGGDRNVERSDRLEARDQLGGIGVAARMRCVGAAGLRRVAAQRDDVANA